MRSFDARRLTDAKKREILERDGYQCVYCREEAEVVDHVVPWSYVHDDSDSNLVAACVRCNGLVSDKVFPTFSDKYNYIRKELKKRARRVPASSCECTECHKLFKPRSEGSTIFLCQECEKLAEMSVRDRNLLQVCDATYESKAIARAQFSLMKKRGDYEPPKRKAKKGKSSRARKLRSQSKPNKPMTFEELISSKLKQARISADAILEEEASYVTV